MNYIGSKYSLLPFLHPIIENVVGTDLSNLVFCDLFAGTGVVGRSFKTAVNKVISNDVEYYSYVLNKNYIENHEEIIGKEEYINRLNALSPINSGFIYQNYCLGSGSGRQYFSDNNGMKIDAIRQQIENWKKSGEINEQLYYFLLCSLLESADKVANTASVYGAFLKHLKKSASKSFVLQPAYYEFNNNRHEVYQEDANDLITHIDGDILYLDPPYNTRQFGANYHLLNTIAEYNPFIPSGKTGLPKYDRSKYCSSITVKTVFDDLIRKANFKFIFLSYNNEGLMSTDEVGKIMSKYGKYDLVQQEYSRFKADRDNNRNIKANSTIEYLHILEKL